MADDNIDVRVRIKEARRASAELKKIAKDLEGIGGSSKKANVDVTKLNQGFSLMGKAITLIEPAAVITGIGLLAQGAAAAGVAVVGLASTLQGPLAAAMLAIPGFGLAAAQGLGAVSFAVGGVVDAVGGLNSALDPAKLEGLTPAAQALAFQLDAMKTPIVELQERVQAGLFPGLSKSLTILEPLFKAFGPVAEATGRAMGGLAVQASTFLAAAQPGIAAFMAGNIPLITALGQTAGNLAVAFGNILVAAGPLLQWMADGLATWTGTLAAMTGTADGAARMAGFFDQARVATSLWIDLIGGLGSGLGGILKGALPAGMELLGVMTRGAETFGAWANSAGGQNQIRQFFADAMPAVYAIGNLIGAVAVAFGQLATQKGVTDVIGMLTGLVPVLASVVATTVEQFGPVLIPAIENLALVMMDLAGTNGPLNIIVGTIGWLAGGLHALFAEHKNAGMLASSVLTVGGALSALGMARFLSNLTGFKKGWDLAGKAVTAFGKTTLGTRVGLLALAAAEGIATVATTALTIPVIGLTAPVWAIVAGIAAVAAVFYLAYTRVGWFRNGVNAVFGFVKNNWPLLLAILTGPIGIATLIIVKKKDAIVGALTAAVGFVKKLPGMMASAGKGMWNWLTDGLANAFSGAGDFAVGIAKKLGNGLIGGLNRMLPDKISIPGAPDINLPNNPIPMLATGGTATAGGWSIVGEKGPEMRYMPAGATVVPLGRRERAQVASPGMGAQLAADAGGTIVVQSVLDGRVIGESVARHGRREAARR